MACRGCANTQCSCFTANSATVNKLGNGSQYSPFTFRPNNIPTPRPFGILNGFTDAPTIDNAAYTGFGASTPDLDLGGNMVTGNGTNLTARANGLHLVGIQTMSVGQAIADLNDGFFIRRNGVQVSGVTFAHTGTTFSGQTIMMTTTTLLDLNTGDLLDLFVDRMAGAGTIALDPNIAAGIGTPVRLWAIWMGGEI